MTNFGAVSYVRATTPLEPRQVVAQQRLDSTATVIFSCSTGVSVDDALVNFANIDSNQTALETYLHDSTGSAGNDTVWFAEDTFNAKGRTKMGMDRNFGMGPGDMLQGKSSGNVVVATLVGRLIQR